MVRVKAGPQLYTDEWRWTDDVDEDDCNCLADCVELCTRDQFGWASIQRAGVAPQSPADKSVCVKEYREGNYEYRDWIPRKNKDNADYHLLFYLDVL